MVGEVESLCDSMSYTGRGLSSWQVQLSQAGYGGEDRLKVVPGPPGWGLGVGLTTAPWNTRTCYQIWSNTIHSPGTTQRKTLRANMTVTFINCLHKKNNLLLNFYCQKLTIMCILTLRIKGLIYLCGLCFSFRGWNNASLLIQVHHKPSLIWSDCWESLPFIVSSEGQ